MFKMAAHRVSPVMPPERQAGEQADDIARARAVAEVDQPGGQGRFRQGRARRTQRPRSIVLGDLPPGVQPINAVDMTLDGARVAAGRANLVQVYDVDSGLEIVSLGGHKDLIQSVRYSPDGTLLAAGSYQIVTVWTAPTGGLLKSMAGHAGPILSLAIAADGVTAYSGGQDKTIRVWNLADGKLLRTLLQAGARDGDCDRSRRAVAGLSGGSDGTIRWLDAADGRERRLREGHTRAVLDLAVLADAAGKIRIRRRRKTARTDLDGGDDRRPTRPPARQSRRLRTLRRSCSLVTRERSGRRRSLRRPDDRHRRRRRDRQVLECRMTANRQGSPIATGHSGSILAVAISPDGKMILTGSADKTARLFARSDGKLHSHVRASQRTGCVAWRFQPNGDRIATADDRGGLKVWETATGLGVIAFGHTPPGGPRFSRCNKVAFSGAGIARFGVGRWNAQDVAISRGPGRCTRRWARMSSASWRSTSARTAVCWRPAAASRRGRAR